MHFPFTPHVRLPNLVALDGQVSLQVSPDGDRDMSCGLTIGEQLVVGEVRQGVGDIEDSQGAHLNRRTDRSIERQWVQLKLARPKKICPFTYHIEEHPESALLIKQVDHDPIEERQTEEHGGMDPSRFVLAFEQPQGKADRQIFDHHWMNYNCFRQNNSIILQFFKMNTAIKYKIKYKIKYN